MSPPSRTRWNIRVVSDSGPFDLLRENMTSSTRPEVHNVSHSRQNRIELRPLATWLLYPHPLADRGQNLTCKSTPSSALTRKISRRSVHCATLDWRKSPILPSSILWWRHLAAYRQIWMRAHYYKPSLFKPNRFYTSTPSRRSGVHKLCHSKAWLTKNKQQVAQLSLTNPRDALHDGKR